jgi:hypothetical protein
MYKKKASQKTTERAADPRGAYFTSFKATCIRRWADGFIATGALPSYRQGKHIKTQSVFTDEPFQDRCRLYLRGLKDENRTPKEFVKGLNDPVDGLLKQIPHAPAAISVKTATRWMRCLGFNIEKASKGWFSDGHERDDVVQYREEFLVKFAAYQARMSKYEGKDMDIAVSPTLAPGEKEIVVVTHDESTFYCNEGKRFFWMENGKKKLLPKCKGTSIMISGFVCACHGFMRHGDKKSYRFFEAGTARDGWFTNSDLCIQIQDCQAVIDHYHPPAQFDIKIGFDQSMTHRAKAPDGLDSTTLNISDGGKNVKNLRAGWYINASGDRVEQPMQLNDGRQKGLRTILEERGKFVGPRGHGLLRLCRPCKERTSREDRVAAGSNDERCCAVYVLSQEPDFKAQKAWLEEVVERLGYELFFYPKYHCELNYIEMSWGWLKAHHRNNCTYTYKDLRASLPNTVEELLPLAFVRRAARHCERFMDGYRRGLTGPLLAYAVKKYRSHRAIPGTATKADLERELAESTSKKRKRRT